MSITALIFDLDETLITDDEATYKALQQTASYAEKQRDIDPEHFYRTAYSRAKQLWRAAPTFAYCNSLGISASEGMWGHFESYGSQWQELHDWVPGYQIAVWEYALTAQGYPDRILAEQLATIFREQRIASQELFPETETVLQGLRSTYKLGILTNGAPDLQRQKIEHSGLARYFDAIVVSGEVGVGKPDPRVFSAVLEQLAVPAHATLMVGDSLERDMLGASQSGLKGVWINREGQSPNQHHAAHIHAQIASLDGLYKIL